MSTPCQRNKMEWQTRNFGLASAVLYPISRRSDIAGADGNGVWFSKQVIVDVTPYLGGQGQEATVSTAWCVHAGCSTRVACE